LTLICLYLFPALAALALRLAEVHETRNLPFVRHPLGDAAGYWEWAQRIVAGDWIGSEPFYQAPLYPYALALGQTLLGDDVGAIRVAQAIGGAGAVLLLALATGHWLGRRAGLTAAWMLALYAPAIYYDGLIQKTALAGVLVAGLLGTLAWFDARPTAGRAAAIGLVGALLALTRENALLWLPIAGAFVILRCRHRAEAPAETSAHHHPGNPDAPLDGLPAAARPRRPKPAAQRRRWGALTCGAAWAGGVAVILAPVAWRNASLGGGWSVTTYQGGANFYIGNSAEADGRYRPLVPGHETPEFERHDARQLAEEAVGGPLSPKEVSRYWWRRAWSDIRAEPGRWLGLLGRKVLMAINAYEVADVESLSVYRRSSIVLDALSPIAHFGVLFAITGWGLVCTRRVAGRIWVCHAMALTMLAAVAAFFILGRYRQPLSLVLLPFAAAGAVDIVARLRFGRVSRLSAPAGVLVVGGAIAFLPVHDVRRLDALSLMNLGVAWAEEGKLDEATTCFAGAVGLHPGSAEARFNLGQALLLRGEYAPAVREFRAAGDLKPDLPMLHLLLGQAYAALGDGQRARAHLQAARREDPDDPRVLEALELLDASGDGGDVSRPDAQEDRPDGAGP
jgi:hypothetical protein